VGGGEEEEGEREIAEGLWSPPGLTPRVNGFPRSCAGRLFQGTLNSLRVT
jgi:hypothetical protein